MMQENEDLSARARKTLWIYVDKTEIWHDLFEDPVFAPLDVATSIRSFQNEIWGALRNNTLINLGSGYPSPEYLQMIQLSGVAKYVAIDLHAFKGQPATDLGLKGVQVETLTDEMLAYTLSLPNNSSNFIICGIDDASALYDGDFHKALAGVVLQKTKPGGMIFTYDSLVTSFLVNQSSLRQLYWTPRDPPPDTWGSYVFQKVVQE
ncbi:MAG TPA: hypothetical protein VMR81_01250 [Patescibacteria group bacterium]|nr:hypothetical protein [Patescibacteria group bacterium]